ncbi:MAG: Na/Pi cotransporter family protein [Eubacteriales bacterium]
MIALIGVVMIMMCKNGKKREIGSILVGFAILMYGMSAMSSAVKPLADMPEFGRILLIFNNPVLGIIAGAVLTGIIQSSSASVGILQALSSTGMLPYSTAVPIIMGQNIGTCVTAMISAIGACKNGKRAACVHLYFNLIGTLLFLTGYYAIDAIVGFPFADEMITEQGIAVIHTAFNVITTLSSFRSAKLSSPASPSATTRRTPKRLEPSTLSKDLVMLDDRFLATPAFALEQCTGVANQMSEVSFKAIKRAMKLVGNYNEKEAEKVRNEEEQADVFEDRLGTYLVKLSSRELSLADSKTATRLLHDIGDYERISDHAVNIVDAAKEMHEKHISFSDEAMHELDVISAAINEILDRTQKAVITGDLEAASHIEPLEQVIDGLRDEIKSRHIDRLRDGRCTIELGFILCDILTN